MNHPEENPILGIIPIEPGVPIKLPEFGTDGAACFDLFLPPTEWGKTILVHPSCHIPLHLGYSVNIPEGWEMKIYSRSGQGFKQRIRLVNCVGIIDSDYTGEIIVGLYNADFHAVQIDPKKAIAQAQLVKLPPRPVFYLRELNKVTTRGAGGFGSTDSTIGETDFNKFLQVENDETPLNALLAAHPASTALSAVPAVPIRAIETLINQAMEQAVANGANSISMPDEVVEVAHWLAYRASTTPSTEQQAVENDNPHGVDRPDEVADYGHDNSVSAAYHTPYDCAKCGNHMGDTDSPKNVPLRKYAVCHCCQEEAPQQEAQEPVLFVSPAQLRGFLSKDDPVDGSGRYLVGRKSSERNFTQPLFTAAQPTISVAPISAKEIAARASVGAIRTDENDNVVLSRNSYRSTMEGRFEQGWRAAEEHYGAHKKGETHAR